MHDLIFGVFYKGQLVFDLGRTTCSHPQAAIIVGILNLAKEALMEGHYFACNYANELIP